MDLQYCNVKYRHTQTKMISSGIVPIRASKIVENYRRSGYTLPDCKNEQDDNSLDAGAKQIGLRLLHAIDDPDRRLESWEHFDNGEGMTRDQIIQHLEIGSAPHGSRLHGMAHTGGKTSAWNIGHDMIVASKVLRGPVHCIKMSTRPLVDNDNASLRWEEVSYEKSISAETRGFFDTFSSGTVVCVKDILDIHKIDVSRIANQLEEGTKNAYNRVPEKTVFTIQVQNNDPVIIHLRDPFYESETAQAKLDNAVDADFAVYRKHGVPYVMLKSTGPIYKGKSGSGSHFTQGIPGSPVYYNITRTLQAREGKSGKPIEWIEEHDLDDYVFVGEMETRAINIKLGHEDNQKSGYHIQRNSRLLGYDKFTDIKSGDPHRYRMRLRINFPPALDEMFGVQFNKKNTTGIQNGHIKGALDEYWRTITKPWIDENKRRVQETKQRQQAAAQPANPFRGQLPVIVTNRPVLTSPESRRSSVTETTSSDIEVTDSDDAPVHIETLPAENMCIAWIHKHEDELKSPEVIAELCRLLNLRSA